MSSCLMLLIRSSVPSLKMPKFIGKKSQTTQIYWYQCPCVLELTASRVKWWWKRVQWNFSFGKWWKLWMCSFISFLSERKWCGYILSKIKPLPRRIVVWWLLNTAKIHQRIFVFDQCCSHIFQSLPMYSVTLWIKYVILMKSIKIRNMYQFFIEYFSSNWWKILNSTKFLRTILPVLGSSKNLYLLRLPFRWNYWIWATFFHHFPLAFIKNETQRTIKLD